MSVFNKDNNVFIESLISIFSVDKGVLKVLLMRKKEDPYKNYWILPGAILNNNETVEDNIVESVYSKVGLPTLYMEQCHTFSDITRYPDDRVVAVSYLGLVDSVTLLLKREKRENIETEWFPISDLPKLGYDHDVVLNKTIEYLSKRMINVSVIKNLFPSDFTLPEIQRVYENVLNINLDRRNFRKKFMNLDIIEETGEKTEGKNGRPGKLYRFKENIKDQIII